MKLAKAKVWRNAEGDLVKDGHPTATMLVAAEGQIVADEYVKGFGNASDFFKEVNPKAPEPGHPSVVPESFKPGQSNAPEIKGLPKDVVGPVKDLSGNATVTGKVGDHEAAIKPSPAKPTKAAKKTKGGKRK